MEKAEFEARLNAVRGAMLRLANLRLPARQDAEDVVQEACLKAFRSLETLSEPDRFQAWIIQITRNQIRDFYRARYRREALLAQARPGNLAHPVRRRDVSDALDALSAPDRELLSRFYLRDESVAEIAGRLGVPEGTVKSRLHAARGRFRDAYPMPVRGEFFMRKLPEIMPDYTIRRLDKAPFPVRIMESLSWFIIPRLGEKINWAMYDFPEKKITNLVEASVAGRASVHGVEGVEVEVVTQDYMDDETVARTFIIQQTSDRCRILAETRMDGDVKRTTTFLDGDDFIKTWGYGPDNCGHEIDLAPKGEIVRDGVRITSSRAHEIMDIVGRYAVTLGGREYDTVCLFQIDDYDAGIAVEQYLDQTGRTVLWRRFNADTWKAERYGGLWSRRMPGNERITVNGQTYVHWYDCITEYVM